MSNLDILGAKKNVDKLLKYVQDIASTDTKLYAKSKDKLRDVASTCTEVVKVISEILQEGMLETDAAEFPAEPSNSSDDNVAEMINNMQTQLDQLRQFAGVDSKPVAPAPIYKPSANSSVTSASKKQIFADYSNCLQNLSTLDFGYDEINQCVYLINRWFQARFVTSIVGSKFSYSMKKFPSWIRDIVILYGKALHDGNVSEFLLNFYTWIDNLADSDARDKYAVPYQVYVFDKSNQASVVNLESVVIWDVLTQNGLDVICKKDNPFYLSATSVYELTGQLQPSVLNGYVDYRDHPEVFAILGWGKEGNKIA